jgi:hypothetical protein
LLRHEEILIKVLEPTTGIDMTTASPRVRENAIKDYQEARWTLAS